MMQILDYDPQRPARDELHFLPPPVEDADKLLLFVEDDDDDTIRSSSTKDNTDFEFLPEEPERNVIRKIYPSYSSSTKNIQSKKKKQTKKVNRFRTTTSSRAQRQQQDDDDELIHDLDDHVWEQSEKTVMYLPDYVKVETSTEFKDFIGSPDSTLLYLSKRKRKTTTTKDDGDDNNNNDDDDDACVCELLSTDCLNTIGCIPTHHHREEEKAAADGIAIRNFIRRHASFWKKPMKSDIGGSPIGMATQYTTVGVFREWLSNNQIPRRLSSNNRKEGFVNETRYDYCVKNKLKGRGCFIQDFTEYEEGDGSSSTSKTTTRSLRMMKRQLLELQQNPLGASPLIYLLAYCHISRITFQLRPFVLDLYQSHLKTVDANARNNDTTAIPFKVGLHVRRGDSCGHRKSGYESKASKLDSPPQVSHNRKCYETDVYLRALRKIQRNLEKTKKNSDDDDKVVDYQLVVYVATDHSSSLLQEIKEADPELYASTTWTYLQYARDIFDYLPHDLDPLAYFIESPENPNKGVLGESAVLDIHHLSHGVDAFVGHLGSRFGKLGWYQAVSVRNGFVPFYTVDGHSTCCDIDENCGTIMAGAVMSMENCLALFYPHIDRFQNNQTRTDYWVDSIGATHRRLAAEAERVWRTNRQDPAKSGIANVQWTNLNVNAATWDYYNNNKKNTNTKQQTKRSTIIEEKEDDDEHEYFTDSEQCREFMEQDIPTSLPVLSSSSRRSSSTTTGGGGACDGYQGILHIRHGDTGGASGTVFFQFMIGQLLWAEQHNYKPWVHMNDVSQVVYDVQVHGNKGVNFTMLDGMKIGWARDPDEPLGYTFPGVPYKETDTLQSKEFIIPGTGIWNHYFYPVSDFNPADDTNDASCRNKPLIAMDYLHVLPGLHSHAPWVPHPWRYWMPEYIQQPDIPMKIWLDDQRKRATTVVQKYIRFNPYLKQRALCAHPAATTNNNSEETTNDAPTLGMHIRHGDKFPSRERIQLEEFFPFAKAFIQAYPEGTIYLATDSALVYHQIQQSWTTGDDDSIGQQLRVVVQPNVQGLSRNDTAAFDLGVSKHRTNVEALTDILALSKCNYLLHGWSAMTEAVFFLNPKLIDNAIDLEMDWTLDITKELQDVAKLDYFKYLLLGGGEMTPLMKKLKLRLP